MSIHSIYQHGVRLARPICAALFLTLVGTSLAHAVTCSVSSDGTSSGGALWSTWAEPMDLQTALNLLYCTEIWVKAGVYKPGNASNDTFYIRPQKAVYGGFAGNETSRDERDPGSQITILSGDIDNNDANAGTTDIDVTSADIVGTNTETLVTMWATTQTGPINSSTVLDGFTITGGSTAVTGGGGLVCRGSSINASSYVESSPTLRNITFSGNYSQIVGGAMFLYLGSPTLNNVTFSGNNAGAGAGAMYMDNSFVTSPMLTNVTFNGNSTNGNGGAIYNAAASSPVLKNVTFSGNSAGGLGGAIFNQGSGISIGSISLSGVIAWGNTSSNGKEIVNTEGNTTIIDHSVVQGSGGSGVGWDSDLGTDSGGNLDTDPLLGALDNHGGSTETMLLGEGSSAIDSMNAAPCNPDVDQRGVSRPQRAGCDIGAVEMEPVILIFTDGFEALP